MLLHSVILCFFFSPFFWSVCLWCGVWGVMLEEEEGWGGERKAKEKQPPRGRGTGGGDNKDKKSEEIDRE